MTYHHKRDPCAKETKEILNTILQMKKSEYELLETPVSDMKLSEQKGSGTNVITQDEEETEIIESSGEDMESYEPTQRMDFKVDEVKDCLEKKKKRRNYLEFRPDYEKD
ncbi:MAG: hypothetical protein ACFFFK_03005 [Candidatus Thorarchaeota archaeon]